MAPKKKKEPSTPDPHGMFAGMAVFLVENGVQTRRLQIWKQRLMQMGASIEDHFSKKVTHVFAMDSNSLLKELDRERLIRSKTWLENSLTEGKMVPEDLYVLSLELESGGGNMQNPSADNTSYFDDSEWTPKKSRISYEGASIASPGHKMDTEDHTGILCDSGHPSHFSGTEITSKVILDPHENAAVTSDSSMLYKPPDLNRNVTEIFGKLVDIYRALGDDWRSFSYYKSIPVIEKLPYKIESADQLKHLPGIGKSMQEHILEVVNTGKLSKLEHFEKDEKVRTISLFGEVWGIGPATALKLYEKGHRTLDDLKNEESLTNSQKIGLKYFQDIKTRIPRHEVEEMERLLQKAGEEILPGGTDSGVDTYFGLCTYPGRELRHRIDFKVYPRDIYAFGLIAWTGNDVLNRRLRLLAESKGFRLDDTGLFPAFQSSHGKRGMKGASLKFDTEKEVFDFLGFPCLEPHERNL
nr:DNA polymerase lambda isoform X1 [Ipomoea batatas]GMC88050.1 DNA polymerase lambda isoform X1 [Ipomoea batatas]